MNRKSFAKQLQDIIKKSGIPQNVVAQALNLSSAAVSQFIHGTSLPSLEQLDTIFELLCVSEEEQLPLTQSLNALRGDSNEEISGDCETGFSEFNINDITLDSFYADFRRNAEDTGGDLIFAEPELEGTPQIFLQDMVDYRRGMGLKAFALTVPHDMLLRDYGSSCTIVEILGNGMELGLEYNGMLKLLVAEETPMVLNSVVLAGLPGGQLRLLSANKKDPCFGLDSLVDNSIDVDSALWTLPVVEITLLPLGNGDPEDNVEEQ